MGYITLFCNVLCKSPTQGPIQDFHNRVSKLGFQEFRVSKIPD